MAERFDVPRVAGQLVWCPADPSLGIGVVKGVDGPRVQVRFLRLQEERAYTTRGPELVILRYQIAHGERVRDKQGNEHKVRRLLRSDEGLATYELDDGSEAVESELIPDVRDIGPRERLATLELVHPEAVRARVQGLTLAELCKRPGYAAALGARVQWLPHQIDVATRAIDSDPTRLLLADEVGLGKTVEAALIYAGLRQEGRANRVLILTPESLCVQWLGEIYRKAAELLVYLDDDRLQDTLKDFPDISPFEAHQRIVVSIDRVAKDEALASEAMTAPWDLVIVDEAHHLQWDKKRGGNPAYQLVEGLARQTRNLLLLTATPMALNPAEYHALLRLLDPHRFDDPAAFDDIAGRAASIRDTARALAGAVEEGKAVPKAVAESISELLSDDEADAKVAKSFLASPAKGKERVGAAAEVLDMLRSRHGLADYVVRNRRGPVGGLPARRAQLFPLDLTEAQDVLIEVGEGVIFDLVRTIKEPRKRWQTLGEMLRALWASPRALSELLVPFSQDLVRELEPLIESVVQAPLDGDGLPTGDGRLRWLVRLIRRQDEGDKVLVFVESAIAVKALKDALESALGGGVAVFHRGLAPRDLDRQVAYFRDPAGPRVMLSTEAGGEGRNFQFCHQVVLYDMPWRPATVEQRIGRVDRVGQTRDVHVLVPHFKSGYEAAILKVMHQAIGVLDRTVGGIDHELEFVAERVAGLILNDAPIDEWKLLYLDTEKLIEAARTRIEAGVDPILDHSSFSPARAAAVLARMPEDIESRTEHFVQRYAEHNKLELRSRGGHLYSVEGAPGAARGEEMESGYVATFSRTYALDHEDVEFLSFGHPLVDQALEWAGQANDASASLALCRGFAKDGAVFIWRYGLVLPDDVPEAAAYFEHRGYTFAVDEAGKRVPDFEKLLDDPERRLERMDPAPLRQSIGRWRQIVEHTHAATEKLAQRHAEAAVESAVQQLTAAFARRERDMLRSHAREQARAKAKERAALKRAHAAGLESLQAERRRLETAIRYATPRAQAAVAVRLMRATAVSA